MAVKKKKAPAKRKSPAKKKPAAKTKKSAFAAIGDGLIEYARGFPEAVEEFPWGDRVMKVKKKVFVFLGRPGEPTISVTTKLPKSGAAALMAPFATMTGYGLGKAGWVTSTFEEGDDVPVPLLREWIRESYKAVAPKKLADSID